MMSCKLTKLQFKSQDALLFELQDALFYTLQNQNSNLEPTSVFLVDNQSVVGWLEQLQQIPYL